MKQCGVDGIVRATLLRRFAFGTTPQSRHVLENCLRSAQKHDQAIAVMYDLSGLRDVGRVARDDPDWAAVPDE
jgi:hypothetical protein